MSSKFSRNEDTMESGKSGASRRLVIAIDGPAGSGKSTVAKIVADKLDYLYIDTGAMYRALTLKALKLNIDLTNENSLADLARRTDVKLAQINGALRVYLDNEDVTKDIRTPEVTNSVKYVASVRGVREHMVALQRRIGEKGAVVLEGRDIGTVVFPSADKKFYLDASFDVRVGRRYKEFRETAVDVAQEEVKADLKKRDDSDINRSIGPLKKADDAILVDTTNLTIDAVVKRILNLIDTK
ncbi:MAG: (d)CMP kinase [Candidatus Omnitrophota bacterium]